MAILLKDGSILMSDGRILWGCNQVCIIDLAELSQLLVKPAWLTAGGVFNGAAGFPGFGGGGRGATGAQGPSGAQGSVGPQGPAGIDGVAAGGSGEVFSSLQAAIDTEAATEETIVPQPGTSSGILVGPATLVPVDDFYMDYYVVNTDTTPSNGLAAQWARVSSYDGATRTFTLDKPWDFSAESDVTLVLPARVWLIQDTDEDIVIPESIELNLEGHRIRGTVDITGGIFRWIRGAGGFITNGVQKINFGVLRTDDCTVSRRNEEIYALLMTEGSNLGRCEVMNCRFGGRVAGRRGYIGWKIENCTNDGVVTVSGTQDIAYALVESIAGVAVVVTACDISVNSELGGAFFYSENSITGPAAFVSIDANIVAPSGALGTVVTPRHFSLFMAAGASVLTISWLTGASAITIGSFRSLLNTGVFATLFCVVRVSTAFSGTLTITLSQQIACEMDGETSTSIVQVEGAGDVSGTVTISGSTISIKGAVQNGSIRVIILNARLTGSISVSSSLSMNGALVGHILYNVSQNAGAPSITISGPITAYSNAAFSYVTFSAGITVSTGTYTISGAQRSEAAQPIDTGVWTSAVTGGTWIISAPLSFIVLNGSNSYTHLSFSGSGGTVTYSGTNSISKPHRFSSGAPLVLVSHGGSGGSAVITGAVNIFYWASSAASMRLATATVSGGTASLTGAVVLYSCYSEGSVIFLNAVAGATVVGPTSVTLEYFNTDSTLTTTVGAGTITWAGATLIFRHCHIQGLFTLVGTNFTTIEAFLSTFNGNSSNNSVTATGTRPTTYRYWKCSFQARYETLLPEVIEAYAIFPAAAAIAAGQVCTVNAAAQATPAVAGTTALEGVALTAAAAANNPTILVTKGRIFVDTTAGTVSGDTTINDAAGVPSSQVVGAPVVGRRVGRALEAVGTTRAGESYTEVNIF
jgi:hypothetical protein